ncbi:N-acetylglucosamine-6-phosphate deacetylase [Salinarimonas chemoclinalis]|uniref:N-acetylglucosamine-6-phosphate deacetylase n=1 Tax=Salinarimonas chemoclinalis TaxID=3241599 RepID=UPI003556D7DB
MTAFAIAAPRLFDGETIRDEAVVVVEDGRIAAVGDAARAQGLPCTRLTQGAILAPGFVDLQVNGGGGVLLNDDPSPAAVEAIVAAHRAHGTTALLPTLISDTEAVLDRLVAAAPAIARVPGVAGFHVEGPFLAPNRRGVHRAEVLRTPGDADFARLARLAAIAPTILTLAPERLADGAIARFVAAGVRVFIGHSDADAETVARAVAEGAVGATHLYNAMSQSTAREPGVVGAVLDDPRLGAGIICDGLHVHPANLRGAYRLMGARRLALVTDAMPSLGSAEGGFVLQGRPIRLEDGRLTAQDGTLAGAHLGMDEAVRNAVHLMGASLVDTLRMATATPAGLAGLGDGRGRVVPGGRADLVALDAALAVVQIWSR